MTSYGPPMSSSDEDDEYDGFTFSCDYDQDGQRIRPKKYVYQQPARTEQDELKDNLLKCAKNGDVNEFRKLFEAKCNELDVDQPLDDWTALMYACHGTHVALVRYLITDWKANVNKIVQSWTPLMLACQTSNITGPNAPNEREAAVLEIVQLLLARKACLNVRNERGETPLMFATASGFDSVVHYFLQNGVSLEACDNDGNTAIFYAVENNRKTIVEKLIAAGVIIDLSNRQSLTPRSLAQQKDYHDIYALFPVEEQPNTVPCEYLSYNLYKELIPTVFPELEKPAYGPDVFRLLHGMRSDGFEYNFFESRMSLTEFLVISDAALQAIGLSFPFQRKRILFGLLKFHNQRFSKESLHRLSVEMNDGLANYFDVFSSCLKHLFILKCTLEFIKRKEYFGNVDNAHKALQQNNDFINDHLKSIASITDKLIQQMNHIDGNRPCRPPLFIDQQSVRDISNLKTIFKRQLVSGISRVILSSIGIGALLYVVNRVRK